MLTEIFESHSCFFQTQHWQNVIFLKKCSKFVSLNQWLFYSMNQFYMYSWMNIQKSCDENHKVRRVLDQFYVCWQRSLEVKAVSSKHNSDKMLYLWMTFKSCLIQIHKATSLEYEPVVCLLKRSLKVEAVSPKQNSKEMLYLWMTFQKLFDQNPQSDFFRVWTSFMGVDKDFWKLKLFLQNTTVTKCYICEWIFKNC